MIVLVMELARLFVIFQFMLGLTMIVGHSKLGTGMEYRTPIGMEILYSCVNVTKGILEPIVR
jgi:hypothetical protein